MRCSYGSLLKSRASFDSRKKFRDFLAFSKTLAELTYKPLTKSRAFFHRTPHDTYVCCSITLQLPFMVSAISSAIWLPMTFIRKSYDKHIVRLTWTRLKYGVPFGPLAISSLAFLYKNKNASFSHENSKRFWNLLVLKNAWLEIARVRERGSEISPSPSHSRSLPLAFLFLNKRARLEIANGPNGTQYLRHTYTNLSVKRTALC